MQGISQSKHQHLVDALLHLENLLGTDLELDLDRRQAVEFRSELENMNIEYIEKLTALAELIEGYHLLFNRTKMRFLSPKLKELRKRLSQDRPVFTLIVDHIRMAYGT